MIVTREKYARHLQKIRDEVSELGDIIASDLRASVETLIRQNLVQARRLIGNNELINKKRLGIEEQTLRLLATQQPVARDMRTLVSILVITGELAQLSDYARGIAKISLVMEEDETLRPATSALTQMAERATEMLRQALDAFERNDIELARSVPHQSRAVNQFYREVHHTLVEVMQNNPPTIGRATYLLWVAHNLERTANRANTICSRTIFVLTGSLETTG